MAGAAPVATGSTQASATGGVWGLKSLGWALFEFARNPYYNLIVIYVFAPYYSNVVVAESLLNAGVYADLPADIARDKANAQGQSMVALAILCAGLAMAVLAPIIGRLSDMGVLRKPPTFLALAALSITACALWFVEPGWSAAVPVGITLMAVGYVLYSIAELFHNSMLPDSAEPKSLPLVSGLGLALGNFAGVAMLVLSLLLLIQPEQPAFGLDKANFEHLRIIGPVCGIWLAVFVIPFFLWMPDRKDHSNTWVGAIKQFFGKKDPDGDYEPFFVNLRRLFKENPNVMRFLIGRMLYADGIAAVLTLGAVYVKGVLDWSDAQVQIYGITASFFAILGAFVGGFLDRILGPKRAIIFELTAIIILLILQLSITPEALLFGLIPADQVVWEGGPYQTLASVIYFAMVVPVGIMLVACITSSRYMVTHIAPREKIGEFYGFYAMAGSVTVWLGPGLVFIMTQISQDQRIGMSGLGILFAVGLFIIFGVKADKTPESSKPNPDY